EVSWNVGEGESPNSFEVTLGDLGETDDDFERYQLDFNSGDMPETSIGKYSTWSKTPEGIIKVKTTWKAFGYTQILESTLDASGGIKTVITEKKGNKNLTKTTIDTLYSDNSSKSELITNEHGKETRRDLLREAPADLPGEDNPPPVDEGPTPVSVSHSETDTEVNVTVNTPTVPEGDAMLVMNSAAAVEGTGTQIIIPLSEGDEITIDLNMTTAGERKLRVQAPVDGKKSSRSLTEKTEVNTVRELGEHIKLSKTEDGSLFAKVTYPLDPATDPMDLEAIVLFNGDVKVNFHARRIATEAFAQGPNGKPTISVQYPGADGKQASETFTTTA
ncbi:MAG: hypothetical protein AAFQ98_21705, partial [Bacteroidota bacterium]